jgi:hypothetical protein
MDLLANVLSQQRIHSVKRGILYTASQIRNLELTGFFVTVTCPGFLKYKGYGVFTQVYNYSLHKSFKIAAWSCVQREHLKAETSFSNHMPPSGMQLPKVS